jgi:hypothetical protein
MNLTFGIPQFLYHQGMTDSHIVSTWVLQQLIRIWEYEATQKDPLLRESVGVCKGFRYNFGSQDGFRGAKETAKS